MEFWIWHKAKRIRCLVPDNTLETLAQMPVSRDAQLLAVYYRHRRRLHDMAHTEVDRGVSVEPVLLDAELFQNVPRPAHRAIKGF